MRSSAASMNGAREDIELAPHKYKGTEYRIFLDPQGLFRVAIGDRQVYASSRAELEQRIADFVGDAMPHDRQSLFFPIMQIDASTPHGFSLSRYWVTMSSQSLKVYMCNWDTAPELREDNMRPIHPVFPEGQCCLRPIGLPVDRYVNGLPFIDTAKGGWVYYALFEEHVWLAFTRLNERLKHRFTINKGAILNELAEGHYSSSQSHMENQLYNDYMWRPFFKDDET